MTTTALPPVNPVVIGWARRESGYGPERIAQRLSVAVDRVLAWEAGARAPTMRQVHNLASFLRRPVTLFFQPAPPQVAPLAAEYRRLPGVIPGKESPELRLALRQMINRRERALDLSDELGVDLPGIGLTAKHVEAPHVVAARIRTRLGIITATNSLGKTDGRLGGTGGQQPNPSVFWYSNSRASRSTKCVV